MKYFLTSIVDKDLKNTVRDLRQKLKKQKRNIDFRELQYLHFDYKYIGANLDNYTLDQIEKALKDFINSNKLSEFSIRLDGLKFGEKWESNPEGLTIEIAQDEYFNKFTRKMHKLLVKLNNPQIVKRKDRNSWLGKIKLGTVKSGISNDDYQEIRDKMDQAKIPEYTNIDNFTVLRTRIRNKQLNYEKIASVKL